MATETYKQARNLVKGRTVIARVTARGRIVERPAVVVRVWNTDPGCVNLAVMLDGPNDDGASNWSTSALHSVEKKPNTWCWVDEQDATAQAH